uniref:Protein kinase domain-containing protein n=1 Tax=Castor canadensis TaxID=51338 RepID=A0A8C0VZK7_CASCN
MEKYERIRVVGRGACLVMFVGVGCNLCLRKADQKLVIIKQIPVEQMTKEERQAAQNECQVLKLLNHPNVIEYYENFLEDKALMIAMEYAPGGTLAEFIQKRCNSLLEEETILHFFVQILLALHHVHTHFILHRDLKTQNILLDKHRMVVKIGDFGISKILSSKSKAYTVVGTPCYISPELCEGKPYNQKSDIWALGCVLYELASLKRAFEAANLPALVLKIMSGTFAPISDRYSPELRQLVLSLLSLEPAQRPPLSHIMAQPLCIRALLNLHTDVGSIRMRRPVGSTGGLGEWVSRSRPVDSGGLMTIPASLMGLMPCSRRRTPGNNEAGHTPSTVICVCMGQWAEHSPAAAHAQHRGGPGGCWAHTEGGRAARFPTGPTPRRRWGHPPPWGSGAAAAPVHLSFPGGSVRCDHQARGLRGPLHCLPDW